MPPRKARPFHHGEWSSYAGFLADGRIVSSGGDAVIRVWSAEGTALAAFEDVGFRRAAAAQTGALVAGVNGGDGAVRVWDADACEVVHALPGHPTAKKKYGSGGNATAAAFSPDAKVLATGGFDDTVRIWDMAKGKLVRELAAGSMVWSLAFSVDGARIAAGTVGGTVALFSGAGKKLAALRASKGAVTSVAFTHEGDVVTGGGRGELQLWTLARGKLQSRGKYIPPDGGGIEGVAISPDGQLLAAASRAGWVRTFTIDGDERKAPKKKGNTFLSAAFAPNGRTLAVAGPSPFLLLAVP